ncbi:MAG: hypothetical protein HY840_07585 [Bacteroidetes bacterium]|nr:hypothetical protein [Bacteroidota bacterium]
MEVIYNELSSQPLSGNKTLANHRIALLIECYKTAHQNGFNKIRFSKQFHEIEIAGGYTLQQWLNETTQRNHKDLILGARTYPFINEEDTWAEDEYILNNFYFENEKHKISKTECLGLAAAHIYDTLSISFTGHSAWINNSLSIIKSNGANNSTANIDITNIFSSACFDKKEIKDFIERISQPVLVPSPLQPNQKSIHLRDDHGKDVLDSFAKRIRNSPYVNEIINSLPYNNRAINFIRRAYPNGLVEIVLYWTDMGLGMVIQTTGRNKRETEEIARLLEREYAP